MTLFHNLVNNLLVNQFWSITPALPTGTAGPRLSVGFPEIIPGVTFIARELKAGDDIPRTERDELNEYIQQGRRYHRTFGLAPITVNSLEDIINHFKASTTPIGRIRFVTHGSTASLFVPIFTGGSWHFGVHKRYLRHLQDSDETGLRYLISAHPPKDPVLIPVTDRIVSGIRSLNSAVLAPFGVEASGMPTGEALKFMGVVNDLYHVKHGSIFTGPTGNPPHALLTNTQRNTVNTSLKIIEDGIRAKLIGTTIGSTTITAAHLDDFKSAVLNATPAQLEILGRPVDLDPDVISRVNTAMAASNPSEKDIRIAIRGAEVQPLFIDHWASLISGIEALHPATLRLGGTDHTETSIRSDPTSTLIAFARICADLHYLRQGPLTINGSAVTNAQKNTLRGAIEVIFNKVRTNVITAIQGITIAELNGLRARMEHLPPRESAATGGTFMIPQNRFTEMHAANRAMQDNFRTKLNHFRGLIKAGNASNFDIRGCMVGQSTSFLDLMRDFLGTAANKPVISAPKWWQSFPTDNHPKTVKNDIFKEINTLVNDGLARINTDDVDVNSAITTWRGLIDFDPHFDFIAALFAAGASKRDFASLGWRFWRSSTAPNGIPILRMQAKRVDDFDTLDLAKIIERFREIFEIPAADTPNAAARAFLKKLQPHLVEFKTQSDKVAAGPSASELPQIAQKLTDLAADITGTQNLDPQPNPAEPLPPAGASLQEIQTSIANMGKLLDNNLDKKLSAYFTAIQGKIGHPNAKIHYYYNIGLPLPIQSLTGRGASPATPTAFSITTYVSASSAAKRKALVADALRSFMRIQWKGNAAQAAAMNTVINALTIKTKAQRKKASQVSMLSENDPIGVPGSNAGICPMETFNRNLATRP